MKEYWDLLDKNGNKTGNKVEKGKVPKGYAHLGVSLWIMNENGELLLQKRSKNKKDSPNKWAMTGGSAMAGENSKQAIIREAKEELGIDINTNHLQLIDKKYVQHNEVMGVFVDIYFVKININLKDLILQKEEVDEAKFVTIEECEDIYKKGNFMRFCWDLVRDYFLDLLNK